MSGLFNELRAALVMLGRRPRSAFLLLLVLSLGMGTSAAVFAVVDAVLLKPLPYPQADRLMVVGRDFGTGEPNLASQHKFLTWRDQAHGFDRLGAYEALASGFAVFTGNHAEHLSGARVSGEFFQTLGVVPQLGREFQRDEERSGVHRALISHGLWQRLFGGRTDILGQKIELDGVGHEIVGVLPRGFVGPPEAQAWVPLPLVGDANDGAHNLTVMGRLGPGMSVQNARAGLQLLAQNYRVAFPQAVMPRETIDAVPLLTYLTGEVAPKLYLLVGAVLCLVLIAVGNAMSLGLTRLSVRRGELAVRYALGASHWRIVRMIFAESLILSGTAAVAGLALSFCLLKSGTRWLPVAALPRLENAGIDLRVVAVVFGFAVAVALVLAITAAVGLHNVHNELRVRSGGTGSAARARAIMVPAQLAVSTMLVVVSSLLIQALVRLNQTDLGLDPKPLLAADVPVSQRHLATITNVAAHFDRLRESLLRDPAVDRVAFATAPPLERALNLPVEVTPGAESSSVDTRAITADYFATVAVPLRSGRGFDAGDRAGTEPVAIVNEAYARRYLTKEAAVDQSLWIGHTIGPPWEEFSARRIVGIVGDVRENGPARRPPPTVFLPLGQVGDVLFWEANRFISPVLLVRGRDRLEGLLGRLEGLVQAVDARQAVARPRALAAVHREYLALPRFLSLLVGGFAALSLLLAIVGLYALISHAVQSRRHEIGIRMALGATRGGVLRQALMQSLRLSIAGIAAGLLLAWPTRLWLASRLPDTPPLGLGLMAITAALLIGAALLASFLPAWHAARIDPLKALREE
jgi:putative ABC transport system permease protein